MKGSVRKTSAPITQRDAMPPDELPCPADPQTVEAMSNEATGGRERQSQRREPVKKEAWSRVGRISQAARRTSFASLGLMRPVAASYCA